MLLSEQFYQTEKTGYLNEQFRLFHLKDQTRKEFSYHYHDFHKVVIFISGKVAYHIEGKAYQLKPWDILLVNRHAIHRPEIDPSVPYERFILWIQNDIPWQELLKCFQKANDRSYNLVRLNSALQEKMKEKTTFSEIKNCVRSTLEPFLYKKTHRNPIVIPVILNSKQTMEELQKNRKNNFHARKPRATKAS